MAEGWALYLKGKFIEPYSAGIIAQGLNPRAVKVMQEIGVDISQHYSKEIGSIRNISFDRVITVCSQAEQSCPTLPDKTKVAHVNFDDPPRLAKFSKTKKRLYFIFAA